MQACPANELEIGQGECSDFHWYPLSSLIKVLNTSSNDPLLTAVRTGIFL